MASSSLSSVVSNLVRASMGASVDTSIADDDLDRHVADLILKEAKQKEERYLGKEGIRVYQPDTGLPEGNLLKPNKRFLNTIIRSVDDHNASIIHLQAKAAADAKEEIKEQARRMRRARADEAAGERLRRLMGAGARRPSDRDNRGSRRPKEDDPFHWSRRDDRDAEHEGSEAGPSSPRRQSRHTRGSHGDGRDSVDKDRSRRHGSAEEDDSSRSSRHERSRRHSKNREDSSRPNDYSKEGSRRSRKEKDEDDTWGGSRGDEIRARRHDSLQRDPYSPSESVSPVGDTDRPSKRPRHRSRSRSPRRSNGSSKQSKNSTPRHRHDRDSPEVVDSGTSTLRRLHPLSQSSKTEAESLPIRSPSPAAITHTHIPSKMDRYFDPSYDPLLDTYPTENLSLNDPVPESAFEHWNNMIELVKMRKEDKADRKRREKEDKRKGKKRKKGEEDEEDERERRIRLGLERPGVMDVKYAKRGVMREWDVGKEVT
ncbi:hypothetical protein FRB94_010663 [Tulasnella sp. JGI-2019a]|nr:hypothetical protein FRB94_010663 [Tulasnella sp. JGI-2019a]